MSSHLGRGTRILVRCITAALFSVVRVWRRVPIIGPRRTRRCVDILYGPLAPRRWVLGLWTAVFLSRRFMTVAIPIVVGTGIAGIWLT